MGQFGSFAAAVYVRRLFFQWVPDLTERRESKLNHYPWLGNMVVKSIPWCIL